MDEIRITKVPALKFLILTIPFFLLGKQFEWNNYTSVVIIFAIITVFSLILTKRINTNFFYFLPILFGLYIAASTSDQIMKIPDKIIPDSPALIKGKIDKILNRQPNYLRCIVRGNLDLQCLPKISNTGIILNIYGLQRKYVDLHAGSVIAATVTCRPSQKETLPTDFSEWQYAASLDVQWLATASSSKVSVIELPSGINYWQEILSGNITKRINSLFPASTAGFVNALLTGDKTQIPSEIRRNYSLAGTAHVLAVSGLHVGIVAAIVFSLLGFVRQRIIKYLIFSVCIAGFVFITGFQPSAIRAFIMTEVGAMIFIFEKKAELANIVSITTILILSVEPSLIYSAAFQMSTASVLGISLLYKPIRNFFDKILKPNKTTVKFVINSLSVTLAASSIVSPIVAIYFGSFSIISPFTNLLVIPLTTIGMALSLASVAFSYIWIWLGQTYAYPADFCLYFSGIINNLAVKLPFAYILGKLALFVSIIFSAGIIYIIISKNARQVLLRVSVVLFVMIGIVIISIPKDNEEVRLYPRTQFVLLEIPLKADKTFYYAIDRRPRLRPLRDIAVEKYILSNPDTLIIGINGNAGINLTDYVREKRQVNIIECDWGFYNTVLEKLKLNKFITQEINL